MLVAMLEMWLLVSEQATSVSLLVLRLEMPELTVLGWVRGQEKMTESLLQSEALTFNTFNILSVPDIKWSNGKASAENELVFVASYDPLS